MSAAWAHISSLEVHFTYSRWLVSYSTVWRQTASISSLVDDIISIILTMPMPLVCRKLHLKPWIMQADAGLSLQTNMYPYIQNNEGQLFTMLCAARLESQCVLCLKGSSRWIHKHLIFTRFAYHEPLKIALLLTVNYLVFTHFKWMTDVW